MYIIFKSLNLIFDIAQSILDVKKKILNFARKSAELPTAVGALVGPHVNFGTFAAAHNIFLEYS